MNTEVKNPKEQAENLVKSWTSEVLNALYSLAAEKKLPENIMLNGVGMTTSFQNGDKVSVNFSFGIIKGGK